MKFCRIKALLEEILSDWDELNLAAKFLVYIGFFLVFSTMFISMYECNDIQLYQKIQIIFRTSLASVFGFLLSSSTKYSSTQNNKKERTAINADEKVITDENNIDDTITENNSIDKVCEIKTETDKYYYREGNSIQIIIATVMILICAAMMLVAYVNIISNDLIIISQYRDLMCTSLGFLLGEAKIKSKT